MDEPVFKAILNFAIAKQYEAERLYHELAAQPNLAQYSTFFNEIAREKVLHAKELERLRFEDISVELPTNMIKEHGVNEPVFAINTDNYHEFRDILSTCAKEEENSMKLYQDLANAATEPSLKNLFKMLAAEEAQHKKAFDEKLSEYWQTRREI